MPLDHDDDGDMDLLVSCPDKPSNGIYFFENPTQDPKVKMPVFKPGVRLGPTGHNVQISYVDGKPRILKENQEYVDFKTKGFDKPATIYKNGKFHPATPAPACGATSTTRTTAIRTSSSASATGATTSGTRPTTAKGRWRNGPLHGYVYLIENVDGKYSDKPTKIEADGSPIDVYGWPSPNFGDFDGDGDLDLLCGEFLDGFTYFENSGTRKSRLWSGAPPFRIRRQAARHARADDHPDRPRLGSGWRPRSHRRRRGRTRRPRRTHR
jgi:hypothetical protein